MARHRNSQQSRAGSLALILFLAALASFGWYIWKELNAYPITRSIKSVDDREMEVRFLGRNGDKFHIERLKDGKHFQIGLHQLHETQRKVIAKLPQGGIPFKKKEDPADPAVLLTKLGPQERKFIKLRQAELKAVTATLIPLRTETNSFDQFTDASQERTVANLEWQESELRRETAFYQKDSQAPPAPVSRMSADDVFPFDRALMQKSGEIIEAEVVGRSKTEIMFIQKDNGKGVTLGIDRLFPAEQVRLRRLPVRPHEFPMPEMLTEQSVNLLVANRLAEIKRLQSKIDELSLEPDWKIRTQVNSKIIAQLKNDIAIQQKEIERAKTMAP
jgi:hypothetical protein